MTTTMPSRSLTRPRWRTPDLDGWPTLGEIAVEWMQTNLVHGPGDLEGEPYRVDVGQVEFLRELYRIDPVSGRRVRRRALKGVAKGNNKTEDAAAVAAFELVGPCVVGSDGRATRRRSPDIPIGAASFEQADKVYGALRVMVGPIADVFDVYDTELLIRGTDHKAYRIAAVAGTNDGGRHTAFIADEVHEWTDRKARVHLVIGNSLMKRQDALELSVTTAGADVDASPAGALYEYGKRVASGEVEDPSFLMHWYEPEAEVDLNVPQSLRAGLAAANPASWVNLDHVAQRWEVDRIPEHEFRRYHLNQWTAAAEAWLPAGAWPELAEPREVPDGTSIVVGFDGSYNRDSTAIVAFTVPDDPDDAPYGFCVRVWEKPDGPAGHDWVVPREEVMATIADLFTRYRVVELAADRARWFHEFETWMDRYGEPVVEFPQTPKRLSDACAKFYDAVVRENLTHDGDPVWSRHLANASTKESEAGVRIVKERPSSRRHIDAAVAGVMAFDRALWRRDQASDPLDNIW